MGAVGSRGMPAWHGWHRAPATARAWTRELLQPSARCRKAGTDFVSVDNSAWG